MLHVSLGIKSAVLYEQPGTGPVKSGMIWEVNARLSAIQGLQFYPRSMRKVDWHEYQPVVSDC